jgi:hypothetical protein
LLLEQMKVVMQEISHMVMHGMIAMPYMDEMMIEIYDNRHLDNMPPYTMDETAQFL